MSLCVLVGKTGIEPVSSDSKSEIITIILFSNLVPPSRTDRDPSVSKTLMLPSHPGGVFAIRVGFEPTKTKVKA